MLSQETCELVLSMYEKGNSIRKISQIVGISKGSVRNMIDYPNKYCTCCSGDIILDPDPEPGYLKEAIRCTGCGAKIFITPCIRCSLT